MKKPKLSLFFPINDYVFHPLKERLDRDYITEYNIISPDSNLIVNYAWAAIERKLPKNIPKISIFLDVPYWRICDPSRRQFWLDYIKQLKEMNKVLSISNTARNQLLDNFGIDSTVFYLGINSLDTNLRNLEVKKEPKILYIGNLIKPKRPEIILEALFYLGMKYKIKDFPQVIFVSRKESTDGDLLRFCYETADRLGINFIHKEIDIFNDPEKVREIKSATVLVDSSYAGGFGFPGVESICFGTIPLLYDLQCFREICGEFPYPIFWKSFKELGELIYKIFFSNEIKIQDEDFKKYGDMFQSKYNPNVSYQNLKNYIEGLLNE